SWLRSQVRHWKHEQHPELCARLEQVTGPTFADAWASLIELAATLYGGPDLECIGTKISWCEEFLPALARAFPELRILMLVRDVRGVAASQNSKRGPGAGKRPLLFYARHWRKSAHFTERFCGPESELPGQAHGVRYEELVTAPERELRAACGHLGLTFGASMLDAGGFRDESERPGWRGNSSFDTPARAIHCESVERWRRVLSRDEVRALESLCGPELRHFGYPISEAPLDPLDCLELDCEPRVEDLSPWIVEDESAAYLRDPALRRREYAAESARALAGGDCESGA
ncbi:MAG: sulfotransferase, partial [Planctomycetota bacterium]